MSSYQPLADFKSEILGYRSPPPSSSWWARSSTETKLVVIGGALVTSLLVLGAGIGLCLTHELPLPNKIFVRSHRHLRPTSSRTYAVATISTDISATISTASSSTVLAIPIATLSDASATTPLSVVIAAATPYSSYYSTPAVPTPSSPLISASVSASAAPASSGNVWQPPVKSTWQIILNHVLDVSALSTSVAPDVDVFDIDLFDNTKETFDALRRLGKRSICYFSAGSYEPNRPDSGDFLSDDRGLELKGWPGEFWLKLNSTNVRQIMTKRIELAAAKGCDAIDPDNIDAYDNVNGIGMTEQHSIEYIQFLSKTAAAYGMSTGLKNGGSIVESVLNHVHFSVNEQCAQYNECGSFQPIIDAGKPVFHIEYPKEVAYLGFTEASLCASGPDFSTVLKNLSLDGYVQECLTSVVANTAILG